MNVSIYSQMTYENKRNRTLGQNKPNQTQFKPIKANMKKCDEKYQNKMKGRRHVDFYRTAKNFQNKATIAPPIYSVSFRPWFNLDFTAEYPLGKITG